MINDEAKIAEFEAAMDSLRRVKQAARGHWQTATGLSEQQVHVLLMLAQEDGCTTTTAAARQMCVSASAATQTIDTLVRRGAVTREADPDDRRVSRLALTATGRQLADTILQERRRYFMSILAELSPDEATTVIDAFKILARTITERYQSTPNERTN